MPARSAISDRSSDGSGRPEVATPVALRRADFKLLAAAVAVALAALVMYRGTLLPGLDFGDTASFQDAGGEIEVSPRQGYPLYFALGNLVVWAVGGEPARGMNLFSAIAGAIACGLLVWLAARVTGSRLAGTFTGLLFAASYTFWSQSIIAEVYALHAVMLTASLLALRWWGDRPASLPRLGVFFAIYALGFDNHLMMVLLLPAATLYLAVRMPEGPGGLLRLRVIALAAGLAALAACFYLWNLRSLWTVPFPPASVADALRTFWFDVTKTDWRASMVVAIDRSAYAARVGMYRFDLWQQFGTPAILLALVGAVWLATRDWRLFLLLASGYVVAMLFAYTYNVGDVHVFFLPSHLFVALAAGAGVAAALEAARRFDARSARRLAAALVGVLSMGYAAWRVYDTWPAVDRSADTRPTRLLADFTRDLAADRSVLVADINWQLQNGLDYYAHRLHPDVLQMPGRPRLLTLPWFIADNLAHGREVALAPASARLLTSAYGDLFAVEPDPRVPQRPLAERLSALPQGTRYVIALLQAYPDIPLDTAELADAVALLTGRHATLPTDGVYTIMMGRLGEPPARVDRDQRPFRLRTRLGDLPIEVRMDSWIPGDTMRRAGFGHVIARHRHVLTLERGVSVAAFDEAGHPILTTYASGLFAPPARFRIRPHPGA
jgi:hypothetical protein